MLGFFSIFGRSQELRRLDQALLGVGFCLSNEVRDMEHRTVVPLSNATI
jgi:hypothetical protein